MRDSVFILLLAICLYSCEKESDTEVKIQIPENFPVTLYAKEVTHISKIRMFTNKKEIYNPITISNYIKRIGRYELPMKESLSEYKELIFVWEDGVASKISENVYNLDYIVIRNNNQFFFMGDRDHIWGWGRHVMQPFVKHHRPAPSSIPDIAIVAYGSYADLELCYIGYTIGRPWWDTLSNEFNIEGIKTLTVTDTLLVQTYRIRYITQ
jgi:hypothetical protein